MATQSTNNDNTDISGEFSTTDLEVSNFCGKLSGYFKGSINNWGCNGEFTSYRLNNDELKGIFIGTMNAYGYIKKCVNLKFAELPEEYLYGEYDNYMNNDDSEDDRSEHDDSNNVDNDYHNTN